MEWFLLLAVDLKTQDIVHWDLVSREDEVNIAWFLIIIKMLIKYPFKGVISDLLPEFFGTIRWLLPGIPHQFCTYHAYRATGFYIKYHYTGGNKLWAERLLLELPFHKCIEDFDFSFQPSIDKRIINDCLTCNFITEKRNIVFIGKPGTGNYRKFLFMERLSKKRTRLEYLLMKIFP